MLQVVMSVGPWPMHAGLPQPLRSHRTSPLRRIRLQQEHPAILNMHFPGVAKSILESKFQRL